MVRQGCSAGEEGADSRRFTSTSRSCRKDAPDCLLSKNLNDRLSWHHASGHSKLNKLSHGYADYAEKNNMSNDHIRGYILRMAGMEKYCEWQLFAASRSRLFSNAVTPNIYPAMPMKMPGYHLARFVEILIW
jgi:hypothetical protein